jgi:hypothetical protein
MMATRFPVQRHAVDPAREVTDTGCLVDDLRSPRRMSILTWVALAVCAAIFVRGLGG